MTEQAAARRAEPTEERILRAAYVCFAQNGIIRTTIEDISREAKVSRPTIYKYYAGKAAILDEISNRETHLVNLEVRKNLVRHEKFADFLTDVLLLVVRTASKNIYIRRLTESQKFQIHAMEKGSSAFEQQRKWWAGMLHHATERNELATDIENDEIITWLTHSQSLLLAYVDSPTISDADVKRLIRRFVVEPLLAEPSRYRV